jgi:integrase
MLNVTTGERDKLLIYLLSSTGMRIGALSDLKVGDIEPMYPSGYQGKYVYKIIVYRGSRQQYFCFCSFECAEALDSYIAYRKRIGEDVTPDSPLLRNPMNSNLPWVKTLKKVKAVKSFVFPINRIVYKAGLRERTHNRQTQHPNMLAHALRKFTISQMEQSNVKYETREFLVGHKTSRGLDNNYLRLSDNDRLNEYMKAVELLTIDPSNRLKKQLAESERTNKFEITELQQQLERLQKDLKVLKHADQRKSKALQDADLGQKLKKLRK